MYIRYRVDDFDLQSYFNILVKYKERNILNDREKIAYNILRKYMV